MSAASVLLPRNMLRSPWPCFELPLHQRWPESECATPVSLQALAPVAAAAGAVARQVLTEMRQAAETVQERWDQRQRELDETEAAVVTGDSSMASPEEIQRFFRRRQLQQEHALAGEGEGEGYAAEEMERGAVPARPPACMLQSSSGPTLAVCKVAL